MLQLADCLGIPRCGHVLLDAIFLEELRQIFTYELQAIVCDDGLRDAKSANHVPPYKALYVRLSRGYHGLYFHPLGKVVSCHDHHTYASSSGRHWPYQVDCPLHKRPRTRSSAGTGLQC
ncbi:hypothetical protein ACFX2I_018542 [Malus domestica]